MLFCTGLTALLFLLVLLNIIRPLLQILQCLLFGCKITLSGLNFKSILLYLLYLLPPLLLLLLGKHSGLIFSHLLLLLQPLCFSHVQHLLLLQFGLTLRYGIIAQIEERCEDVMVIRLRTHDTLKFALVIMSA